MPGPSMHSAGPPWSHDAWGGGPWAMRDPDAHPRPSRALRLWVPVIVSALVQLTAAAWILRLGSPIRRPLRSPWRWRRSGRSP